MIMMIKIATIISFLTAPFYAIANYLLITSKIPLRVAPVKRIKIIELVGDSLFNRL